jgi:hypothetical protein
MKTPYVCTEQATHRPIVSKILNPPGALLAFVWLRPQSSGGLQRLKNHKSSWSAHESPDYRHCFSHKRTAIKWAPVLQDLGSQLLRFIGFSFLKNSWISLGTHPFCTKFTISHKIKQPALLFKQLSINHLSPTTSYPSPHPHVQKPIRQKPISNLQIRNPPLNSQREHLLLGTIIEAGSGSHLYSQRERLSLGTSIEAGSGSQSAIRNPQSAKVSCPYIGLYRKLLAFKISSLCIRQIQLGISPEILHFGQINSHMFT